MIWNNQCSLEGSFTNSKQIDCATWITIRAASLFNSPKPSGSTECQWPRLEAEMKSFLSKSIKWISLPSSLILFLPGLLSLKCFLSLESNAFRKFYHRTPPEAIYFRTHSIAVHFNPLHQYSWLANKRGMIKDDEICVRKQPMEGEEMWVVHKKDTSIR